ncbi:MAG TPA: EAL domain-containing protein [Jatrophihabitans sp.]|uniref:putative bifunctional diguanylate cyclase/phosphodiesterase n=1 Tax=Jatrophihabitans sp. TaxID=1932789 RepID=UPI002F1D09DA
MSRQLERRAALASRTVRMLGIAIWIVISVGFILNLVGANGPSDMVRTAHILTLAVFFVLILLRIAIAAIARLRRPTALWVLFAALTLWAAGSAVLNASSSEPDLTHFPAPGEWLFLASYLGIAGYLIIDTAHRLTAAVDGWLEAIVVCGGTACLAGSPLLVRVGGVVGGRGVPLLLAMLYPMIDVALILLVVAQVVLRVRRSLEKSAVLCLGLTLFAIADLNFVTNLSDGTYGFNVVDGLLWAAGFALIVEAACRPGTEVLKALPKRPGPLLMVGPAFIALSVLAVRPHTGLGPYLTWPAVLTLLAAGGRLVLALREAKGAAEAFALSRTDDLTLLPNRRSVIARLDAELASDRPLALMLLDLDGFKDVNDTLGHAAGDSVLQLAAHRMRQALPASVMIGRLGGDEYAVVMTSDDALVLLETAHLILEVLLEPTLVEGIELTTNASIGITVRSPSDTQSVELLRRADVAMYQAKSTRAGAVLYDVHSDDFSRKKLQLAEELRKAIPEGQLVLYYQPQIDAATQRVCGLEALVRWQHPERGLLNPIAFLPAARREGLMLPLSVAVGQMVVEDLRRWRNVGLEPRVSLNCAPPELLSGVFLPRLYEAIAEARLPAESLVIEVTEDCFIAEPARARTILRDIRAHRVQIAIDDYGTGFSSLSYLRDLPVQELKMDRSFIAAMNTDTRSRMIVASTFQMAQALGLRTVAEGVENAATAADLIAMGVDVLQGYHVAKPMPASEVEFWIRHRTTVSDGRFDSLPMDGQRLDP